MLSLFGNLFYFLWVSKINLGVDASQFFFFCDEWWCILCVSSMLRTVIVVDDTNIYCVVLGAVLWVIYLFFFFFFAYSLPDHLRKWALFFFPVLYMKGLNKVRDYYTWISKFLLHRSVSINSVVKCRCVTEWGSISSPVAAEGGVYLSDSLDSAPDRSAVLCWPCLFGKVLIVMHCFSVFPYFQPYYITF